MKRCISSGLILLGWLFIFGCYTQSPKIAGHEYSTQKKMQSAHHWDVLAEDVAMQIKLTLANLDSITQPVYVEPACGAPFGPCEPHEESPFGQGFRDLLITNLVKLGITTIDEIEEGALVVTSKAQVVYHKADRKARQFPGGIISGIATTLAGAIWVIRDAYEYGSTGYQSAGLALAGIGAAAWYDVTDGMISQKKTPHSEVIITTSIKEHNAYLMRKTDVYYINDLDYWHYMTPPPAQVFEIRDS